MRIATRVAGAAFAAAAMGALMVPSAGAATSAPANGSQISAVDDSHGCYSHRHRLYTHYHCYSDYYGRPGDGDDFRGGDFGDDHGHEHAHSVAPATPVVPNP